MLAVPFAGFSKFESNSTAATASVSGPGTAVAANATPHTKTTTPVEIIASTAFDAYMIAVYVSGAPQANTNTRALLDIMVGGSGSETVLIPNLLTGYLENGAGGRIYYFPLWIPAGTRISARAQSAVASYSIDTTVYLFGGVNGVPPRAGSSVTAYNIDTATSGTTNNLDLGNNNAVGSWAEIVGSAGDHFAWEMGAQGGTDTTLGDVGNFCELGVGAAAAETVIISGFSIGTASNEALGGPWPSFAFFDLPIASGQRVAIRGAEAATTNSAMDIALYGVS